VYACDQILKSRLVAALAFEQAFRDFAVQSDNKAFQVNTALNVLSKDEDALEVYGFQKRQKDKEYKDAHESLGVAEKSYGEICASVKVTKIHFNSKLAEWKEKQEDAANWEIVTAVIDITVAIGLTIATGGADSAAIIKAGKKGVEAGKKVKETVKKIAEIFEKMEKLMTAIVEIFKKIKEAIKRSDEVHEMMHKFEKSTKAMGLLKSPETLKPSDGTLDLHNAMAAWSDFEVEVNRLEKSMEEVDVEDKAPYFDAMRKMVIHGKTVILTKVAVVQKGDEVACLLFQETLGRRNNERIRLTVDSAEKTKEVARILMLAMYDRLVSIRGLVFLDFLSYEIAYRFHTLLDGRS
jgi:hypothetical protein